MKSFAKWCLSINLLLLTSGQIRASEETRTTAVLTTMIEATLATSALLRDQTFLKELRWTAKYSDRNFLLNVDGSSESGPIQFIVSGFLWGEDGSDWLVSYGGFGVKGKDPIQINGRMDWRYDSASSDHTEMDFSQVSKFGSDSDWGWVIGTEIGVGAVIGAGGAIATAVVATGGIASLLAIPIGIAGASTMAGGFVGASAGVKSLMTSSNPTPPPIRPKRPARPRNDDKIFPSKDSIITAVAANGNLIGEAFETVSLSGKAGAGSAEGFIRPK